MRSASAVVLFALASALVWSHAARAQPAWAGTCGLPKATTLWVDYGWPSLAPIFGRPGIVVTASTGDFPAQMRRAGAGTVYFDLNLNKRVGTPTAPANPATLADRAATFYDFADQQMGCPTPTIVENELFGASTVTPWSDGNAQYRQNVLAFLQALAAKGAHPVLLVNSKPYTGTPDAAAWWQQVPTVADVVREVVPACDHAVEARAAAREPYPSHEVPRRDRSAHVDRDSRLAARVDGELRDHARVRRARRSPIADGLVRGGEVAVALRAGRRA